MRDRLRHQDYCIRVGSVGRSHNPVLNAIGGRVAAAYALIMIITFTHTLLGAISWNETCFTEGQNKVRPLTATGCSHLALVIKISGFSVSDQCDRGVRCDIT
jgi:hypothetical protein